MKRRTEYARAATAGLVAVLLTVAAGTAANAVDEVASPAPESALEGAGYAAATSGPETSAALSYTRTHTISGSFRASVTTPKLDNVNNGNIKVAAVISNCDPLYPKAYAQLWRVSLTGSMTKVGGQVSWACDQGLQYTWTGLSNVGYKVEFKRSNGYDENLKTVDGTAYYG